VGEVVDAEERHLRGSVIGFGGNGKFLVGVGLDSGKICSGLHGWWGVVGGGER